ncbi:hypothetical protein [Yinghuangia soli]|uniref:Uncharacterized protein n=1 Tax=Yinghuangia soli TaxID=2908204 RepID=A0AA41U0J3_9ACTN|nr:hypothetical protein [Yinghuangia soli]MCF2528510.1 hypothetical protein [Yinghuangia soli]
MKYVVAAAKAPTVDACRHALGERPDVEFRVGSAPETGADCDAAIVSWPPAHDRYGGFPKAGAAQVLVNERGDGAPGFILATPPPQASSYGPADSDVEDQALRILDACVAEFLREFPESREDAKILIHLEGAALDHPDLGPPLKGIREFLDRPR